MTLDFYTNPMSRGQIVRWALEEAGAPYNEHIIQYGPEMKGEAFLAVNPMGKVPAVKHNGKVVTESSAICAYIADAFPEAGLGPTDEERADYLRWLFFAAGPLENAITSKSAGIEPTEEQMRTFGFGNFDLTIGALKDWLAENDYICGERFTMADVYIGANVDFGLQFGTVPKDPVFEAYAQRLQQREAYGKAKARDGALIAEMQAAQEG